MPMNGWPMNAEILSPVFGAPLALLVDAQAILSAGHFGTFPSRKIRFAGAPGANRDRSERPRTAARDRPRPHPRPLPAPGPASFCASPAKGPRRIHPPLRPHFPEFTVDCGSA